MKTIKHCLAVLFAVFASAQLAYSGENDSSSRMMRHDAQERLDYIKVKPVNDVVDSNDLMHGKAQAVFQFWVDANSAELNFHCLVTDMQRDRKGASRDDNVITLDQAYGCRISPVNALSPAGEDSVTLKFDNKKSFLEGRDAIKSDYVTFKTRGGENFRQKMFVKLLWDRRGSSLPVGEYSAAVTLVAEHPSPLKPPK